MKLATSFVPLYKVKPTLSRWNFSEAELEGAVQLVLESEGIINPIVLQRESGSESYRVLDGNFEYYAAAHAHQLDPRCCESIEAFVVEPRDEALIRKQLALFRRHSTDLSKTDFSKTDFSKSVQPDRTGGQPSQLLVLFNQATPDQLLAQIRRIGLTGRNAEKVVESIAQERQQTPFLSLKDAVMRIRGLSYEKMIDLVEAQLPYSL